MLSKSRYLRRVVLLCVGPTATFACAVAVVSCASPPRQPEPQINVSTTVAEEVEVPAVEITADLLYDILLGEIAHQRGEIEVSAQALVRAAETSRDPRIAERAALLAVRARRYEEALVAAELWRELQPDSRAAMELLAGALLATEDIKGAEQQYREMIESSGDEVGYMYRRIAQAISRYGEGQEILALMDRLIELTPDNAEAHYSKAYIADSIDQPDEAGRALDRALELNPTWEDAATAKAAHLMAQGQKAQVKDFSKAFLKKTPGANKLREQFARFLVDFGEREEALSQFEQLADRDPENADALFTAALLGIQLEQLPEAADFLERHLQLRPKNDQARVYLGQVSLELERFQSAKEVLSAVSQESYYFEAQVLLGGVTAKLGTTEEALQHLQTLVPSSDEERVRLVLAEEQILREANQLDRAKEALDLGLSVLPDNSELLYARGLVAAQLSLIELHEQDLRKLLEIDPGNAHALNALGYTLADQTDRHGEALDLITQALELRPDDPFIMDSMGWVQYRLGNHAVAIDYLERALKTRPDAEIAAHLGEVLWVTGERRRAESVWNRALKESPLNDVLLGTIQKLKQ